MIDQSEQFPLKAPRRRNQLFRRAKVDQLDFVVAGVQKAGTTALHYFLSKHPHVALPQDQALHFFDKEENFVAEPNYQILHSNFNPSWRWRTAGEVTADYVYYPGAIERIARYNPAMKLIISLRDPTERAFSQWNMRRAKGREPLDFLAAIDRDQQLRGSPEPRGNAHIDRSLYFPQMERVFRFFPRDQVLVIKYERFRADYMETLNALFSFIGLRPLRRVANKEQNTGPYARRMTADERAQVVPIFYDDIVRLESLLGWDCSDWRSTSVQSKTAAV